MMSPARASCARIPARRRPEPRGGERPQVGTDRGKRAGDRRNSPALLTHDDGSAIRKTESMSTEPVIQVQNVVKQFGAVTAVDNISLEVRKGEIFAFLGPNGAGKTTTIRMLTTLLKPTSGSLKLNGLDPTSHPHEVRRVFGIVFQDPSLDQDLTAWENMDIHGA